MLRVPYDEEQNELFSAYQSCWWSQSVMSWIIERLEHMLSRTHPQAEIGPDKKFGFEVEIAATDLHIDWDYCPLL